MHAASLILLAAAGLAAAQTPTSTAAPGTFSCAAENIVEACLGSTQPRLQACTYGDWDCMCAAAQDVLTCYNNCPGDPNQFGAQQTETQYCNAAKAYGTSAQASTKTPATTTLTSATGGATAVASTTVVNNVAATGTRAATSAKETGASGGAMAPGASLGMMGALAGAVALFL